MTIRHIAKSKPAPNESVLVWTDIDGEHMWAPAWQLNGYPDTWMMHGDGELSIAHAQHWQPMPKPPGDEI